MFWNDIEDIKSGILSIASRLDALEKRAHCSAESLSTIPIRCDGQRVMDAVVEDIKELLCDVFCSEDENNTINRLHDKVDGLIKDANREEAVLLAEKTLDKFEDYMKNVDKFNAMINGFKGCVAMARSSIAEGNILSKTIDEMKKVADISQHIHKSMLAFIRAGDSLEQKSFFKINAIYKAVCESEEKKPIKKKKVVKKKVVSPAP